MALSLIATGLTLIVTIILAKTYKQIFVKGLLMYALSIAMFSIHSLTHAVMFVYKPRIYIDGRSLSLLDLIHTLAAFAGILLLYIAVEYSHEREIPNRALALFFIAGGALASEFLGQDPFADPLALMLETIGLFAITIIILGNYISLLRYTENRKARQVIYMFLIGILLLVTSPITNVAMAYMSAPESLIDIWEIQFVVAVILLAITLYHKPYILVEAYSRPKLFAVTDENGKILYMVKLDRKLKREEIKQIEDYLKGIPILTQELIGTEGMPRELRFSNIEIVTSKKGETIGYLITNKTSKTLTKILDTIVEKFQKEIYPILKKEKPTQEEIDKLQRFDIEVKNLITETTY